MYELTRMLKPTDCFSYSILLGNEATDRGELSSCNETAIGNKFPCVYTTPVIAFCLPQTLGPCLIYGNCTEYK